MENRILIALALAFLILITYQFLILKSRPQESQKQPKLAEKEKSTPVIPSTPLEKTSKVISKIENTSIEPKDIKIENELYLAILTTKGATLKHFELKKYKDEFGENVVLLKTPGIKAPLAMGSNEDFEFMDVNFNFTGKDLSLDEKQKSGSIIFEYRAKDLFIKRTYTFYHDSYKIDIKDEITGLSDYWITLGSNFGIQDKKHTFVHIGPVILKDTDRIEFNPDKLEEPKTYKGNLKWIAQEDKYFFASIVPLTEVKEAKIWKQKDLAIMAFRGNPNVNSFVLYAGPKEYDTLKAFNLGLEHVIDFGFFSIIALPLFWILKLFYKITHNYGWAIILLTIIIRIPFIPLINKSQKSMKKMQELQPKMAELREKYKKDPQRLQREMMELYKKYKINPVGGCLPILLQIPVFFALYKILLIAIELRNAHFMLWIKDLSAPDTLFGHIPEWFPLIGGFAIGPLPILMGISMIIQQKMTPTSLDPTQNKIMMLMPIIFTFLFLNFASGLVLYWLVNNIFSIIQQFYVNKKLAKEA